MISLFLFIFYNKEMNVSSFSKMIKNGSQMSKRYDLTNFDDNMKEIIKSISLRLYMRSNSTLPPILMHSPPGCGKTHLVCAIIQKFQDDYDYLWVDSSDIMSSYYGETQKNISSIFEAARKHNKPVILFFDEIDGLFGEHKDSQSVDIQNITTFKQETDGNKDNSNLIIIGATNHFDKICDAIKSRFSNQYEFHLPNSDQRKKFFRYKFSKVANKLGNNDFTYLANQTDGKSFRDLEKVFNEIIRISAQLNEEAKYFVVGHGIDIEGKEKDLLYVAVPLYDDDECIYVRNKKKEFILNLAQVPITNDIIRYYFSKIKRRLPRLPEYEGPVFDKYSIENEKKNKEILENKKKNLMVGSIILGIFIFVISHLLTISIFQNQIKKHPRLKLISLLINAIISYSLIMWMDPKGDTDIEKLHPIAKYIRKVAEIIGEIIVKIVEIPVIKKMSLSTKIMQFFERAIQWNSKYIIKPIKKIANTVKSAFISVANFIKMRVFA